MSSSLAPVFYLPHGGGPLPLLADPHHLALTQFLTELGDTLATPAAILVISAHWENAQPALTATKSPALLFDYSGFPPESYQYRYPAPGAPALANEIAAALQQHGFAAQLDNNRGWDHGVFVPLMLLRPQADVPVLQLSLLKSLDPMQHIALGEAIAFLRQKNVLIIGSGMSFHNMRAFFQPDLVSLPQVAAFNQYLIDSLNSVLSYDEQATRLSAWLDAPYARLMHPREEHLLPLHVCFGAAKGSRAKLLFQHEVIQREVLAFGWFD
ncbi:DODA-type extradiol aromatic ring-opening family dioxygenase [Rheinheimera nanhaiensis]|uniref:4,5-DOPA dioxygenase extradiol n=1 Tax=Rheinheimera nanhaiensis E407-8 TaxID=562729 RepID=I1DVE5_9GAMM|nr:class III extradiol ring-cleavage dioxygenase [Rheinheimera nanhaiensis]GAB58023.1 4,5-DOPA dioxygenase extradiol [Rheinheimera nanhaiensis E407-8]